MNQKADQSRANSQKIAEAENYGFQLTLTSCHSIIIFNIFGLKVKLSVLCCEENEDDS